MFENVQLLAVSVDELVLLDSLIKYISCEESENLSIILEQPVFLKWHVENKYFEADVQTSFCLFDQVKKNNADFENLECVVVTFSSSDSGCLQKIIDIASALDANKPEVCLLYDAKGSSDTQNEIRDKVFEWSIENNFELVENSNEVDNHDDGFEEKFGFERIIEALNSHVWSNHVRKDPKSTSTTENVENSIQKSAEEASDCFQNGASFDEIFSKFHEMKEKAQSLDGVARKEYAEKVALAFMDALGIDDNNVVKDN